MAVMGYTTVRVNVGALIIDGIDDDDIYDDVPVSGKLLLEPMIDPGKPVQVSDGGRMKIKAIAPFPVDIGLTGEISHRNKEYVTVPAPTSATSNVAQLQWRATFLDLKYGTTAVSVPPIFFWAEPGLSIDLGDHINIAPNPTAVQLSRGARGFGVVGAVPVEDEEVASFAIEYETNSGTALSDPIPLPGGGAPTNATVAPLVVNAGATRTAVDDRVKAVGDEHYAPVSVATEVAGKLTTPSGGTTGQVLSKTSGGFAWANQSGDVPLTFDNDPAFAAFRYGLATRDVKPAVVACIGSSTTEGWNASMRGNQWVDLLGQAFAAQFGGGGSYVLTNDPAWGITGTAADVSEGVAARSLRLEAGATMTLTVDDCDGFTILSCEGATQAGAFTVSIDGAAATTVTPADNGSFRHWGERLFSIARRGRHTIKITASAQTTINGVYAHRGDKYTGVQVWNSGRAGARAQDFGSFYIWQRLERLAPSLVTMIFGANDFGGQVPIATYKTELQNRINTMKAWTKVPSILLLSTYKRLDQASPAITWDQYRQATQEVAEANPGVCAFRDITDLWPASQALDVFDVIDTDDVHMTDAGHKLYLSQMSAFLAVPATSKRAPVELGAVKGLAAQFSPSSLGLADAAAVTSWQACGSRPVPATPDGGTAPTFTLTGGPGGKSGVKFDASLSQRLYSTWGAATLPIPAITIAATFRTPAVLTEANLFSGASGNWFNFDILGSTFRMGVAGAGQLVSDSGVALPDTDYAVVLVYAGSGGAKMFINQLGGYKSGTVATATLAGIRFASNPGGAAAFASYTLGEFALYDRAIPDSVSRTLMRGMADRIGLTI